LKDGLNAGHLLSRDSTRVNKTVFFDCVMAMQHGCSRPIPDYVARDEEGRKLWTGKQLLSMAIPEELNLERGDVRIYGGQLVNGTLDKKLLGKCSYRQLFAFSFRKMLTIFDLGVGSGSLVHLVVQQLGEDRARNFLDNLHDVCVCWITHTGFTFSMGDIVIPAHHQSEFRTIVHDAQTRVQEYVKKSSIFYKNPTNFFLFDRYIDHITDPDTGELTTDEM
jgi:hypothetical protein